MKPLILSTPEAITLERISYLINEKSIDPVIAEINLEMVKMKLRKSEDEEGLGWSYEQCDEGEIEYKRFLHLIKKFSGFQIVPHKIMDLMWHQHILDTRAYHKDCDKIFGEYLHHFPYFGIRSEADKKNLDTAFSETESLYSLEFKEEMTEKESSHCKRACKSYCKRACNT